MKRILCQTCENMINCKASETEGFMMQQAI